MLRILRPDVRVAARRRCKELFAKIGDFPFVWCLGSLPNGLMVGVTELNAESLKTVFLWSRKFPKQLTRNKQNFKTLSRDAGFTFVVVGVSLSF